MLNRDIPDLESRITQFVPASLSYAACSWRSHLPNTDLPPELWQALGDFLRDKLLFWFELLSLLKSVNLAAPALYAALKCYDVRLALHLLEL